MNKKGFVLTETIIVSVFIVTIFTFVFSSVFPLIGKYEDMAEREENIDILYKLYNIRKMINNDTLKVQLLNMDFKRITCEDFQDSSECEKLMDMLDLDNYILVYANGIASNLGVLQNIDSEISLYIDKHKTENKKTLVLLDRNAYTIANIDLKENNTNAYYRIKTSIIKSQCDNPTVTENNITYLSGDNDCIDFNYVWYSGKMWRITAIYPDQTIKMITNDAITSIPYGNNYDFYTDETTKSYAYQWLNEDFLSTLNNYNSLLLKDTGDKRWNAAPTNASGNGITGTNYVTAYVGLMNAREHYLSYQNTSNAENGYLGKTDNMTKPKWYTLHPKSNDAWYNNWGNGIRPMVYLKSGVAFSSGMGTMDNPFTILGDIERGKTNERINTRSSGEYIKFKNESNAPTYRIVSTENVGGNTITKIIANYYAVNTTKYLSYKTEFSNSSGSSNPSNYLDYYLNNTFYNNIVSTNGSYFTEGPYYLGLANESACYKEAICTSYNANIKVDNCTKTEVKNFKVGLARFGEMFATSITNYDLKKIGKTRQNTWLITTFNTSKNFRYINSNGESGARNSSGTFEGTNSSKMYARPTLYLKSNIIILSGNGTPSNPYVVGE